MASLRNRDNRTKNESEIDEREIDYKHSSTDTIFGNLTVTNIADSFAIAFAIFLTIKIVGYCSQYLDYSKNNI